MYVQSQNRVVEHT